jgi:preprotein translocase subunit SecG
MLQSIVLFVHLAVGLLLIGLVLLQRGKGADAGTGFGAGASGTVFGARGSASFLSRTTGVLAAIFFATSLTLAYFANQAPSADSLVDSVVTDDVSSAPAVVPPADEPPEVELPEIELPDIGSDETTEPVEGDQ